jgi:hypothetical protein
MNLCRDCGQDFAGVSYFDQHRVGTHQYTYSQGAAMDPPREDGRRCLSIAEMEAKGWRRNARGRWADPEAVERLREAHRSAGTPADPEVEE